MKMGGAEWAGAGVLIACWVGAAILTDALERSLGAELSGMLLLVLGLVGIYLAQRVRDACAARRRSPPPSSS